METVTVNAQALRQVLAALIGPPHLIRELQATRSFDALPGFTANPINTLLAEFNQATKAAAEQED